MSTLTLVEPLRRARSSGLVEGLRSRVAQHRDRRALQAAWASGDHREQLDLAAGARRSA
ncbi:MAG: hypothetical protein JWO60_309 [Frankiales bacterium]|nr:hypothetical protein [Frankiales bacterium]